MIRIALQLCILLSVLGTVVADVPSHNQQQLPKLHDNMQLTVLSNVTRKLNQSSDFHQTAPANRTLMHALTTLPELSEFAQMVRSSEKFSTLFADRSVALTLFIPINDNFQLAPNWRSHTRYPEGQQYIDYTLGYHIYALGALDVGAFPVDIPVAIRSLALNSSNVALPILLFNSQGELQVNCANTSAQPIRLVNGVLVPISRPLNATTEGKAALGILEHGHRVNCSSSSV